VSGSLFKDPDGLALRNRPYFLPAGTDEARITSTFSRHVRRPDRSQKLFYFRRGEVRRVRTARCSSPKVSVHRHHRAEHAGAGRPAAGNFSNTNTVISTR
jgi:hypothetical protein